MCFWNLIAVPLSSMGVPINGKIRDFPVDVSKDYNANYTEGQKAHLHGIQFFRDGSVHDAGKGREAP